MNYQQAIEFLYQLRLFGTKLGLENTFRLAHLCGNPHQNLRFIHVAGTNGKGSTCAMLENIYRVTDLKTGLFTSPHLISFTERMQVNRIPIAESDVARLVRQVLAAIHLENDGRPQDDWSFRPTFFEFITVMALLYFQEQKCDLVIWETGMGGRLDATNIVIPLASVITNIQWDHQAWLGDTLAKIAFEKAGIIKPAVPVITATQDAEALAAIKKTVYEQKSPLHLVQQDLPGFALSLRGPHQRWNAAVALRVIDVLQEIFPVSPDQIRRGFASANWAGRLQLHIKQDGSRVLLDGAHNLDGVKSLRAALETDFAESPKTLVLGMFSDKAWKLMVQEIAPIASRILLCPVLSQRTATPQQMSALCQEANPAAQVLECASIQEGLSLSAADKFTVVTGSLHFIGEAMEWLGLQPGRSDERKLNEWQASGPGPLAP